jgi:hypothetical protein
MTHLFPTILLVVEFSQNFPGDYTLNFRAGTLSQILYRQSKTPRSRLAIRDFPLLISDGYPVQI